MASSHEKTWTLQEKKSLLQAIQIYGKDDFEKLAACVGTKSLSEVKFFANKMKQGFSYQKPPAADKKAKTGKNKAGSDTPIEVWLETAEDVTHKSRDLSYVLGQVMSVIEKLEPRQARGKKDPNYSNLYGYIGALLRNQEPPQLSTCEAAIMLEVLQNLFEELKEMDLTMQTKLMREKYRLMNSKIDINDRRSSYMNIRAALTNEKAGPSRQSASTSQTTPTNESPGTSTVSQSTSRTQPEATSSEQSEAQTTQNISSDTAQTLQSHSSLQTGVTDQGETVSNTQTGALDNSGVQANQTAESSHSVQSQASSPLQTSNQELTTGNQGSSTQSTPSESHEDSNQSQNSSHVPTVTVANSNTEAANQDEATNSNSQSEPRRPGRKRKHVDVPTVQEIKPQKNELFSLNPFCIPVKYLNPQKRSK